MKGRLDIQENVDAVDHDATLAHQAPRDDGSLAHFPFHDDKYDDQEDEADERPDNVGRAP